MPNIDICQNMLRHFRCICLYCGSVWGNIMTKKQHPIFKGLLFILFVMFFLLISNTLYFKGGALQYAVLTVKRMSTFSYLCFYKSDEYVTNIS